MRLSVNGSFLSKPISGIGRYACEMATALKVMDVSCHFLHTKPVHPTFEQYMEDINMQKSIRSSDIFWGPNHRLPLSLPSHVPAVLSVLDLVWRRHPETMRLRTKLGENLLFPRAIHRADLIACLSQSTADDLSFFYPRVTKKIRIVLPGAQPASAKPNSSSRPFALFVGTFEPRKNLERLIDAYANLSKSAKNACNLKIVGRRGWGGVKPREIIKAKNVGEWAEVIENPDERQLNQLYADCSFLAAPSIYEGFGLPIIEAMKYGKPCIASDVSSMPEIVAKAGILVDPFSVSAITDALDHLIKEQTEREQMAVNARRQAKRFSWPASAARLHAVISELR